MKSDVMQNNSGTTAIDDQGRRAAQFIRFAQLVAAACAAIVIFDLVMVLVNGKTQLIGLIILTSVLGTAGLVAAFLARSGRLPAGVYFWSTGMAATLALYPLAADGMLSGIVLGAVVNLLLVALFLSPRQVKWAMPMVVGLIGVAAWLDKLDLPWQRMSTLSQLPLMPFVVNLAGLGFVALLINMLGNNLLNALESSQANAKDLEESHVALVLQTENLKAMTAELVTRTGELELLNLEYRTASQQAQHRAELLSTSAMVARTVSELRQVGEILPRVALLIGQAFGYYHVGIFLVDELKRYAVLNAVNSEEEMRLLEDGNRVPIESANLIGAAIITGQPQIAHGIESDAAGLNPERPQTRSQIALPLRIGSQVFGVLDAHSAQADRFTEEDVAILGALADQVAIAIENARLFAQTQATLKEAQQVQENYLRREWEELLPTLRTIHHEYRVSGVPALGEAPLPEIDQALRQQEAIKIAVPHQAGDRQVYTGALAVPIKLRDQIIGVIDLHETDQPREWTDEDVALVEEVADQAAQALETVRLFEQTQQQARREQLTSAIAARLRAAPDVEGVLKATVHELRRVLGVSHGAIRLRPGHIDTPALTDKGATT